MLHSVEHCSRLNPPRTLSAKLGLVGFGLLLVALASIGVTLWLSWQLEGGAAAVNEAGRMRMQTWRLAQALGRADDGRRDALVAEFERSLERLERGDPARPLVLPQDERTRAAYAQVRSDWSGLRARWTATPAADGGGVAADADGFVARIDGLVDAIESRLAHWTTLLHLSQFVLLGLAIAAAVALLYSAWLLVFDPLARLQRGLARVEAGDLGARVDAAGSAEFGAVASVFNRMAQTLQELYQNLEAKVEEKTVTLEAERVRLAALYEASALAARARTLDGLARGFVQQLRRVARADAAALRWTDESHARYLLLASDCLPEALQAAEPCIDAGACGCGAAPANAKARVIPVHAESPAPLGHCTQAGYAHVLALPVRLNERLLGEVDLFYRGDAIEGSDERALLEALVAHLAAAIESRRVGALEREAAIADERSLLARELHDSIAQGLSFLKIQVQLLRDALGRGERSRIERVLAEVDTGVRESIADVRELLVHFRTRTNTGDLRPALQTTLRKFEHQTGLATQLEVRGHGVPLPADVQVQVLHVVQEALSNVRKHAAAHRVWVEVDEAPVWCVQVRDDGCGFAPDGDAADETHVGLRIMRERAQAIGAAVEVRSQPGAGTRVVLTLPEPA